MAWLSLAGLENHAPRGGSPPNTQTRSPSISSVDFFILVFLLARFGGLFCFYFSIGQARFTAARHLQSKYLQMLNEEIQKENNTITDGGVAPRCSFAGPT